jgi:hypothetical protein
VTHGFAGLSAMTWTSGPLAGSTWSPAEARTVAARRGARAPRGAVQEGAMCVAANVNVDMARGGLGVDDGEVAQYDADEATHNRPRD